MCVFVLVVSVISIVLVEQYSCCAGIPLSLVRRGFGAHKSVTCFMWLARACNSVFFVGYCRSDLFFVCCFFFNQTWSSRLNCFILCHIGAWADYCSFVINSCSYPHPFWVWWIDVSLAIMPYHLSFSSSLRHFNCLSNLYTCWNDNLFNR